MPVTNHRGVPVPKPSEDPLASVIAMAAGTLGFTLAENAADAGLKVDQAKAGGATVSSSNPIPFLLNGGRNAYIHNGGDRLQMINEPEWKEDNIAGTGAWQTIAKGGNLQVLASSLPTRPWRRLLIAFACINVNVGKGDGNVAGECYLRLTTGGNDSVGRARLDEGDQQTAVMWDFRALEANQPPNVRMRLEASNTSSVQVFISTMTTVNRLGVLALPLSMADSL